MNSGMVRGIAFDCHRLLSPAQECSDKMRAAITGVSGYWVDLGGEEFKQHCEEWIKKMNEFKAAIAQIEANMMNYADKLQVEEERAEAARIKEAERQASERAAAAAAAAAAKSTGKIK
ncbi:hypothetical protein NSQ91_09340 [Paenibacillus sp. FSL R7-0048]|jgi:uncharacterized protein YukE|uniref:hypothetical protein n=1 Tax=Paenibacillus TaxID=44249 RepID=UPI00096CCEBD|nr:hypothetical protein [Paenibacillus odorifer]OMD73418.1 hypothetical protein BSK48_06020 [Paenibacillus odorifer]OMD88536.1 hypothetical protein BSK67_26820 [Paenibacillus odorifer]OME01294.1 hypothetical protein BSK54_13680 [Paenibacillus odorifer]